jgi:hypothetical protein
MKTELNSSEMLFGPHGPLMFGIMMLFLLVGAIIRKGILLRQRKVSSQSSPRKFKLSYWLQDNWGDMFIGFMLAFIMVRFPFMYIEPMAKTIFPTIPVEELLFAGSVVVGYCIDKIAEQLSRTFKLKA